MNEFTPYWLASIVVAVVWSLTLFRVEREHRRLLGVGGAWLAALVLTAFAQAEAVPWLWSFLVGVLAIWQAAMVLLIVGAVGAWRGRSPRWRSLTSLAVLGLAIQVGAGLQFLWLATVSPGGV